MTLPHVGFIGIGRMGRPMAAHIRAAGYPLTVADVHVPNLEPLVALGAAAATDAAAVAAVADVILTCVPGPDEVEHLFFAPDGLLSAMRPGSIFIETSTIGAELSRRIGTACAAHGAGYIDAPISGAVEGAERGTLTVMAGGDAATLERARPVLACFAQRIVHLGPTGAGHVSKLINQLVYLGYVALFCEAASVAAAYDIDRVDLIDVLRHSVAGAPLSTNWDERLRSGDRTPGFSIARVLKDFRLGAAACDAVDADAPIVAAALASFERAEAEGAGGRDITAIYRPRSST